VSRRDTPGGDLPLMAWGEDLRRRKAERRRLRSRAALLAALIGAVALSVARPPAPRLVWNASASAPIGLYLVSPESAARRGDMVIARVPIGVRELAAARRYIPIDVPLVKHVGAVPGDTVCAIGTAIISDNQTVATRRATDGVGRRMPWWNGCRSLHQGDVFLLADHVPASFDGRYFGISSSADIIGTARPIWTR
jgi:conjugative transfer signal peptidase TraF